MIICVTISACLVVAVLPIAVRRFFQGPRWMIGWSLFLIVVAAAASWIVRGFVAAQWRSGQCIHVRWNVDWFSDQYNRIDRLGNEDLRRDYVTNFCRNACMLLNLDMKTAPNTSNLVQRYYYDWDERIFEAEQSASTPKNSEEGAQQHVK